MDLPVFIATITGNAEMVAEDVADAIEDDVTCTLTNMDDATFDALKEGELVLIVSSTYGVGDVPDNGLDTYERLLEEKPDLSNLKYGTIGLGDSTYADSFAFGGRKWDAALTDLGATRLGEVLILDASSSDDPSDLAVAWAKEWIKEL